jgi:ribosomal protein S18 acetylase RimI-like enzyme
VERTYEIRLLGPEDIELIGEIDRSEHMETEYSVVGGRLESRRVDFDIPTWHRQGTGDFSVAGVIEEWRPVVAAGAVLLGAFRGDQLLGIAIVERDLEPGLAWLAFLHVSRKHRRRGVAKALWAAAESIAAEAGSAAMYVSAAPSGSAVGFYLSRGCELADPPHPELLAKEPEDIHLVCPIV